MTVRRIAVHVIMVAAIVIGILVGTRLLTVFAGG